MGFGVCKPQPLGENRSDSGVFSPIAPHWALAMHSPGEAGMEGQETEVMTLALLIAESFDERAFGWLPI